MSSLIKRMSRDAAVRIVIYIAVAYWIINIGQTLSEQHLPWSLVLLHPVFFVHLLFGGALFVAVWRIAED